jgi:hypothetical protein
MTEFKDPKGRLIVMLRTGRCEFCVYVNGRRQAVFTSGTEAVEYAKALAEPQDDPQTR